MKFMLTLATATVVLASALGMIPVPKAPERNFSKELSISPYYQQQTVGLDKCKTCNSFADEALSVLLNEILQMGVVGGCGALCQAVINKTGSQALGAICNLACDTEGVKEFVKIVQEADVDPIYYCELLKECPINDDGDCKISKFEVTPKSGPQGDFVISFEYVSVNGLGTGEIVLDIDIDTVDHLPLGQGFLHELAPAGTYPGTFKLRAQPDPDCDPSQGPCEEWLPGTYTVKLAICNGECGSKHPNSQIYDEATTTFEITN